VRQSSDVLSHVRTQPHTDIDLSLCCHCAKGEVWVDAKVRLMPQRFLALCKYKVALRFSLGPISKTIIDNQIIILASASPFVQRTKVPHLVCNCGNTLSDLALECYSHRHSSMRPSQCHFQARATRHRDWHSAGTSAAQRSSVDKVKYYPPGYMLV
jgi:hypothetical protein